MGSAPTVGAGARFEVNTERRQKLWTYEARVERVIDGDTIAVVVDCGFGLSCPQRLRLNGIDTPELYTRAGQAARAYVEEQLAAAGGFVVVATRKTDLYGRYLADVACPAGESRDGERVLAEGTFLNRELLAGRLARRYG